jgi:hypothetical protein
MIQLSSGRALRGLAHPRDIEISWSAKVEVQPVFLVNCSMEECLQIAALGEAVEILIGKFR